MFFPVGPSSSDAWILGLLRRREPQGFDLAYATYGGRILRFLRRLSGQNELAEDLLQEVFLKLAERGPTLDVDSNLRAWLFTVARNAFLSDRRRTREVLGVTTPEPEQRLDPEVEARLLLGDVDAALSSIRFEDREILLLVGVEDLPRETVARMLGIDAAALRQRLARARSRLLAELARRDALSSSVPPAVQEIES